MAKFLLPFREGRANLQRFSPAAVLLFAFSIGIFVAIQSNPFAVLTILSMIFLGGIITRTRWRVVLSLAARFELLILFWMFLMPFIYGNTILLSIALPWGTLYAYQEGLTFGILVGLRMMTMVILFITVLSHLSLTEFIDALRTLRVPRAILGSLLIMLRYIPLFMTERKRMQEAQHLRGYNRGKRFERIKSLGYLVGTTINRSFSRSANVYEAMSLRGFGKGTMVSRSGFKRSDVLLPLLLLVFILSLPFLVTKIMEVLLV
ncbi:MAG: energy-coupling factor transporter transmembrane component T family protein [Candidatus Thorarchaeota archaeon]